jgi:hypothetical protein
MAIHLADERLLDRRDPDLDPGLGRASQALHLVAMMVSDEDAADAVDAELGQGIEGGAGTEVDEDAAAAVLNEIDVAGIGQAVQVLADSLSVRHFEPQVYRAM